jgi:hypothetical protein
VVDGRIAERLPEGLGPTDALIAAIQELVDQVIPAPPPG